MDLNLIRTFVAVYELRSVSEAADYLYITQPSVSYALRKLREEFKDELFIRQQLSMLPTKKADVIYTSFKKALNEIEGLLRQQQNFQPAHSTYNLTIAVSDLGADFFVPFIFEVLNQYAPNMSLEVIQLDHHYAHEWLSKGRVDLIICNKIKDLHEFNFDVILKDHYIGITRRNNPRVHDDLHHLKYILVSSNSGHQYIEQWMQNHHVNIALRLPTFNLLPNLLSQSEHIAIVPYTLAKRMQHEIDLLPLSFDLPGLEIGVYRSNTLHTPAEVDWLIEFIRIHQW